MSPAAWGVVFAVFSIIGGALLTAVAGFIGARIQARREHERWVRERRFEAYKNMLQVMFAMDGHAAQVASNRAQFADIVEQFEALKVEPNKQGARVLKRQLDRHLVERDQTEEDKRRVNAAIDAELGAFAILGPGTVMSATLRALRAESGDARDAAIAELTDVMHDALDISDEERKPWWSGEN